MRSRGFTLVELIVTAATIGILAGMALPNYRRTVERAHLRAARDVLLTIYTGEQVYASLNDGVYATDWSDIFMVDPNPIAPPSTQFFVWPIPLGFPQPYRQFCGVASVGTRLLGIDEGGNQYCTAGADCPDGMSQVSDLTACIN